MGCAHHIFPLPPRSAKPSEGEEVFIYTYLSSGSLRSPEVKHNSPPSATLYKQSFLDSCLAKRRLFCVFQNLKPVGFCVFGEFCGNYKQRSHKYKSLSPINCNLHFNKRSVYAVRVVKVHGGHDVFFHHGKTFA